MPYLNPETQEPADLPDSLVLPLSTPISYKEKKAAELQLREPTLSQVAGAHAKLDGAVVNSQLAEREYELTFIALNTGLPRIMMDDLRARDIRAAIDYLSAFVSCTLPEATYDPLDDVLAIDLAEPITANGKTEMQLDLREPTGGALLEAERQLGAQMPPLPGPVRKYQWRLITGCSNFSHAHAGNLPIRVAREAVRFLEGFERSAPATGERSGTP